MKCTRAGARLPLPLSGRNFRGDQRTRRLRNAKHRTYYPKRLHCTKGSVEINADPTVDTSPQSTPSHNKLTFQEAISNLEQYWSSVGCAIWLPHNTEVGAGTMNPATFLRVLGPEPWNVCYAEPSIRPDDSRFGDNPNRIQRHTQFQVILKPDPGNPQDLYLKSLEVIGIDCAAHDIRFVEDNWESPVLGAWGLGWEVWIDGMEITQFTYFQQAGGLELPVPSIEITYGLERILMSLQNVDHFKDIQYTPDLTYGELLLETEVEMSKYNLQEALVEDHWKRFELYKKEAAAMVERKLALPAYDNLLKCSHTFNILDARGAVGVTERNVCFGAMRKLTRQVAALWLDLRKEMEFPLLKETVSSREEGVSTASSSAEARQFVLEVGCEEMPPHDVIDAMDQINQKFRDLLKDERLEHGPIEVCGTPRRVVVLVHDLAGSQTAVDSKIRGPPVNIAYSEDGSPSKALSGFCKKTNCDPEDVFVEKDAKGTEFIFVVKREEARNTAEVLREKLIDVLRGITFKKSMKWNGEETWSRPIRWILALHGNTVVPLEFAGVRSANVTKLGRMVPDEEAEVGSAEDYLQILTDSEIIIQLDQRKSEIWKRAREVAESCKGSIPETLKDNLLDEVTNLVESPHILAGQFSPDFLSLPKEVLETVMKKYQRYFPVYSLDGEEMLPFFVAVGNGEFIPTVVRKGYQDVLRARFKDAQFFYEEDLRSSLESFVPKLAGTQFHKALGNLLEKTERTERLIEPIARLLGIEEAVSDAKRAARLARADLATSLVTEMTSLTGTMGRHYALKSKERKEVADAIFESALPRFSGDVAPKTPAGVVANIADKMDSLVGLVAANCAPTATADPYGLRRMAYGLVVALIENESRFDLGEAIGLAADLQPLDVSDEVEMETFSFIQRRLEQYLLDKGIQPEIVRSVLAERSADPYFCYRTSIELAAEMEKGSSSLLPKVLTAFSRAVRITKGKKIDGPVDLDKFEQDEERDLWTSYENTLAEVHDGTNVAEFLEICDKDIIGKIDRFFEEVFVMAEDKGVKENRLRMLKKISSLSRGLFDLSELPGV